MTPPSHHQDLPPALLLGDDPVNVLGVARNLGRAGVRVERIGSENPGVLRSRYIRSVHVVPGLESCCDADFVASLELAARLTDGRPVLFPLHDLHVLRVARSAARLRSSFSLLASSLDATETLVNKRRFYESLARFGVPHPTTLFPRERAEYERGAAEIGYPVFLKPEISPDFFMKFRRKGFVAHDAQELRRHLDVLEPSGLPVMLQEIIPGGATCMGGCAGVRTDTSFLVFCYRRVREFPSGFGNGCLLESVPRFDAQTPLLEYLDSLPYRGIFDAEFKLDPRDGVHKLIEINARPWWQSTHPSLSGFNVVKSAYDHAIGRRLVPLDYCVGTKWIDLQHDYKAARQAGLSVRAWLRSWKGPRCFDIWAQDDPRPMLSFLFGIVRRRAGSRSRAAA